VKENGMTQKKIKQEVIDELTKEYRGSEDSRALFTALKTAVMERALNAERARRRLPRSPTIAMGTAARRCWASPVP
jgi:hypothetical protein